MKKKKIPIILFVLSIFILIIYFYFKQIKQKEKEFIKNKIIFRYIDSNFDNKKLVEGMKYFSGVVSQKTEGKILIEIRYKNVTEKEIMDDIKMGLVDISKINLERYRKEYLKIVEVIEKTNEEEIKGQEREEIKRVIAEQEKMLIPLGFLITKSSTIPEIDVILISRLSWNNLSENEKKIVISSMEETEDYLRKQENF